MFRGWKDKKKRVMYQCQVSGSDIIYTDIIYSDIICSEGLLDYGSSMQCIETPGNPSNYIQSKRGYCGEFIPRTNSMPVLSVTQLSLNCILPSVPQGLHFSEYFPQPFMFCFQPRPESYWL